MLDCLILGDSLAVGVGQARPGCTTVARTGVTSGGYLQALLPGAPRAANHVVISLGVNDDASMATLDNLRRLRREVVARQVTWLLPGLKEEVRGHIRTVARERGDRLVDTSSQAGPDRLHPGGQGYRVIATWTEQGGAPLSTAAAPAAPGPQILAMTAMARPGAGTLPRVHTPSAMQNLWAGRGGLYASWPPASAAYAAIPPREYSFGAFSPSLPRPVLR